MPLVNSKKQDKSRLCRLQFAEKRQTQDFLWQRNFMQIAKFMCVYFVDGIHAYVVTFQLHSTGPVKFTPAIKLNVLAGRGFTVAASQKLQAPRPGIVNR